MQLINEAIERIDLMLVSFERRGLHLVEQSAETVLSRWARPQREGVDVKADLFFQFLPLPACQRRAHNDVLLKSVAVEQGIDRRQQHHEETRSLLLSETQ